MQIPVQLTLATWLTASVGIDICLFHVGGMMGKLRARAFVWLLGCMG